MPQCNKNPSYALEGYYTVYAIQWHACTHILSGRLPLDLVHSVCAQGSAEAGALEVSADAAPYTNPTRVNIHAHVI